MAFEYDGPAVDYPEAAEPPTGPWTALGWLLFLVALVCSPVVVIAAWGAVL